MQSNYDISLNEPTPSNLATKMQALDQALLFLSSFVLLFFSVLGLSLGLPYSGLISFLPLVLVSVLLPLYVGYMRGAVELDSLQERARGWVYLLFGSFFYLGIVVMSQVSLTSGAIFLYYGLLLGLAWFTKRYVRWFYKVGGKDISALPRDRVAIIGTVGGTFVADAGLVLVGTAGGLFSKNQIAEVTPASALSTLLGSILLVLILFLIELNCHHYLDEAISHKEAMRLATVPSRTRFGNKIVEYVQSPLAVLFAGSKHRQQYLVMLVTFIVSAMGGLMSSTSAFYSTGLAIEVIAIILFCVGLIWHARVPPEKTSSNKIIDWFVKILF